jgi:hypothetical protein
MTRTLPPVILALVVALAVSSCAPHDSERPNGTPPNGPGPQTDKGPVELPADLRDRVDLALKHIRNRDLLREHSFWTVFHGILGIGPESAYLFDSRTGKRVKALDYICDGGDLRGLQFTEIAPGRVDVVTMPGSGTGQGHQDQFLAEMLQWGVPRDRKILVDGKPYTFDAFIQHSKERCSVKRDQELSWAIIIIAEHFGTDYKWVNQFGESLHYEDVVRYELDQPIKDCKVCGGTHRLFGLTWAYHRHLAAGGKKLGVWKDVEAVTNQYKELARKLQNKDGAFSTEYFRGPGNNQTDLTLRIHSTGHVLEWLALALSDAELRETWMQDAAATLAAMILSNQNQGLDGGAVYHATHGLEMYRNRVFGPTPHPPVIPPYPK